MGVRTLFLLTISSLCGCVCGPSVMTVGPQPPNIMPPPPPILPFLQMMLPTPQNVAVRPGIHTNAGNQPFAGMNPQLAGPVPSQPVALQPMANGYQQPWVGQSPLPRPTLRQRFMNITRNRNRNVQRTGPTVNRYVYAPRTKYAAPRNNQVRNVQRGSQYYGSDDYWYAQASMPTNPQTAQYHEPAYDVREPDCAAPQHQHDQSQSQPDYSLPPTLHYESATAPVQEIWEAPRYESQTMMNSQPMYQDHSMSQPELQPCPCTSASGPAPAPQSSQVKPALIPPEKASNSVPAERNQPMPQTQSVEPPQENNREYEDPVNRRAYESGVGPERISPPPAEAPSSFDTVPSPVEAEPATEMNPQSFYRKPVQRQRIFTPQPVNPRKYQVSQARTQGGSGVQRMSLSVPVEPAPPQPLVQLQPVPFPPAVVPPASVQQSTLRVPAQTPAALQPATPAIQIPDQRIAIEPDSVFFRRVEDHRN